MLPIRIIKPNFVEVLYALDLSEGRFTDNVEPIDNRWLTWVGPDLLAFRVSSKTYKFINFRKVNPFFREILPGGNVQLSLSSPMPNGELVAIMVAQADLSSLTCSTKTATGSSGR